MKLSPVIEGEGEVNLRAYKNLGLVFPPLLPLPSHHLAPPPSRICPLAPEIWIPVPETGTSGPSQFLVAECGGALKDKQMHITKVCSIFPLQHTWVSAVRSVRSSVVPEGTAILSSTMVEQAFFEAEAAEAAVEVQEPARFPKASPIAGVGRHWTQAGLAARAAATTAAIVANSVRQAFMSNTIEDNNEGSHEEPTGT